MKAKWCMCLTGSLTRASEGIEILVGLLPDVNIKHFNCRVVPTH